MVIHVLIDVYPHPFKPYFDVQFEEWEKAGHQVTVFSTSCIPGIASPVEVRPVRTLRDHPLRRIGQVLEAFIRSPSRTFSVMKSGAGLREKIKLLVTDSQLDREMPDLFFVHNLAACLRFAYLKHVLPGIPLALYFHGGEIPGVPSIPVARSRPALEAPDIIFTNTRYSKSDAVRRGAHPGKIRCIPVGFRVQDYALPASRSYLEGGKVSLASVGRFSVEKGFDIALRALSEFKKKNPWDFRYTMIGNGPEMENLKKLVETLDLAEHVEFTGYLDAAEVARHLSRTDVLILPSVPAGNCEENQACVMQEAMLMGAVVIASDLGGVAESIPDAMKPYLFRPGDVDQLCRKMAELLSCGAETIGKLGTVGREFVLSNYDSRIVNAKLLAEAKEIGQGASFDGASPEEGDQQIGNHHAF